MQSRSEPVTAVFTVAYRRVGVTTVFIITTALLAGKHLSGR